MLKYQVTFISAFPFPSVYPNMILFKPQISIFRSVTPTNEAQRFKKKPQHLENPKKKSGFKVKLSPAAFWVLTCNLVIAVLFFEVVSIN